MKSISENILHNDHHLVIVNKPAAFPLMDNQKGRPSGLMSMVQAYVKRDLFLVNRIDTPVSGLIVLAKNKEAAAHLSAQFKNRDIEKLYLAVSRMRSDQDEGLWEDRIDQLSKINKSVLEKEGKVAITNFRWIESLDHVHLYVLRPKTGRHHQLRVQMAEHIGPIRGDQKYGDKRGNKDRSIDLHAWGLKLKHPSSNEELIFQSPPPEAPPWSHFKVLKSNTDVREYFEN